MATLVKITDIEQMKTNFAQLENKEPKAVSAPDALQQMIKEINGALARGYSHEELYDLFIAGSGVEIGLATFRSYLNKANGKKKKRKPQPKLVITSAMTDAVKSKEVEKATEDMVAFPSSENQGIAGQANEKELPEVTDVSLFTLSNASHQEMSEPAKPVDQSHVLGSVSDGHGIRSGSHSQSDEKVLSNSLDDLLVGADDIHKAEAGTTNEVAERDLKQIGLKLSSLGDDKKSAPTTGQRMSAEVTV